jgi:hypothetical protein
MAFSNQESPTGMSFLVPFTDFRFAAICWLAGCVVALLRSGSDAIMELRITILKHRTCFTLFFLQYFVFVLLLFLQREGTKKKQVDSCVAAIGRAVKTVSTVFLAILLEPV